MKRGKLKRSSHPNKITGRPGSSAELVATLKRKGEKLYFLRITLSKDSTDSSKTTWKKYEMCVLICVTAAKSRYFSQSVTRHSRFLLTYIFPLWQAHVTALPHLMISWKSWKSKLWISFSYPNRSQFCLKLSWFDPTESGLNNLEVHIKPRYLPSIESAHFQAFSCCEPHLFPEKSEYAEETMLALMLFLKVLSYWLEWQGSKSVTVWTMSKTLFWVGGGPHLKVVEDQVDFFKSPWIHARLCEIKHVSSREESRMKTTVEPDPCKERCWCEAAASFIHHLEFQSEL